MADGANEAYKTKELSDWQKFREISYRIYWANVDSKKPHAKTAQEFMPLNGEVVKKSKPVRLTKKQKENIQRTLDRLNNKA
jgi:hypothetical protein